MNKKERERAVGQKGKRMDAVWDGKTDRKNIWVEKGRQTRGEKMRHAKKDDGIERMRRENEQKRRKNQINKRT